MGSPTLRGIRLGSHEEHAEREADEGERENQGPGVQGPLNDLDIRKG